MKITSNHYITAGLLACFLCFSNRSVAEDFALTVSIKNPLSTARKAVPVVIPLEKYFPNRHFTSAQVLGNGTEIASQLDDLDGDRKADELVFVTDMAKEQTATFRIALSETAESKSYPRKVRAYLKLHDQKGKHPEIKSVTYPGDANLLDMYNSIYGHGTVFESELAGFRIYMDNRQSIDIYGKTKPQLELDHTGFYTTRTQLDEGYGCDILWAGQSVGAGSFRGYDQGSPCYIDTTDWRKQTVIADGPVRTIVEMEDCNWRYHGKQLQMTQRYILYAGHRDIEVNIDITGTTPEEVFCTGVQKLENQNVGFITADGLAGSWGSNIPDKSDTTWIETAGLGLFVDPVYQKSCREDDINYLFLLQTDSADRICYHVSICAGREEKGFKSSKEWFDYLKSWKTELTNPCHIRINKAG